MLSERYSPKPAGFDFDSIAAELFFAWWANPSSLYPVLKQIRERPFTANQERWTATHRICSDPGFHGVRPVHHERSRGSSDPRHSLPQFKKWKALLWDICNGG